MAKNFPGGVWPVMLVPFKNNGEVDYEGVKCLVDWYIGKGVAGLFAVCQSSEMFCLSLEEMVKIAEEVVRAANGRVPVIASGHISDGEEMQVKEVNAMAESGVDAVILLTNRFASEGEDDSIWMQRVERFLEKINPDIPLGFYECPYPYKRLISLENLQTCARSGRFFFLKDTCCDLGLIERRLDCIRGTNLKLYNANSSTLYESLLKGAAGFSGVMANFHPQLYVYLCGHLEEERVRYLKDFISLASLIERQYYPVNAKYFLKEFEGLPIETYCRKLDDGGLNSTYQAELRMLKELTDLVESYY